MSFNDWQLIDDGSFNGLRKYIRSSDEDEGTVQVLTQSDATPILEANKRAQAASAGTRMGDGLEKVASIPAHIIYEWITQARDQPLQPQPPGRGEAAAQQLRLSMVESARNHHLTERPLKWLTC
jgi:hypothetical protein